MPTHIISGSTPACSHAKQRPYARIRWLFHRNQIYSELIAQFACFPQELGMVEPHPAGSLHYRFENQPCNLIGFSLKRERSGAISSGFQLPLNRERGCGTKKRTGSAEPNAPCIPVTGSHTLMAFHVSPWYPQRIVAKFVFLCEPLRLTAACTAIFMATSVATEPESA